MTAPDRGPCLVATCPGRAEFFGLCDPHAIRFFVQLGTCQNLHAARSEWLLKQAMAAGTPVAEVVARRNPEARPRCELWHHVLAVAVGVATGVTALALVAAVMAAGGGM